MERSRFGSRVTPATLTRRARRLQGPRRRTQLRWPPPPTLTRSPWREGEAVLMRRQAAVAVAVLREMGLGTAHISVTTCTTLLGGSSRYYHSRCCCSLSSFGSISKVSSSQFGLLL
ncbi:hypothetical protein VPH35_001766 [Triticum aestivum]